MCILLLEEMEQFNVSNLSHFNMLEVSVTNWVTMLNYSSVAGVKFYISAILFKNSD